MAINKQELLQALSELGIKVSAGQLTSSSPPNRKTFDQLPPGGQVRATDILCAQRGTEFYQVYALGQPYSLIASEDLLDGQAVCLDVDGKLTPAISDSVDTTKVIGFVRGDTPEGESVELYSAFATIPNRTLLVGSYYYLSWTVPGEITEIIPDLNNYLAPVGIAVATNQIQINIAYPTYINSSIVNKYTNLYTSSDFIAGVLEIPPSEHQLGNTPAISVTVSDTTGDFEIAESNVDINGVVQIIASGVTGFNCRVTLIG